MSLTHRIPTKFMQSRLSPLPLVSIIMPTYNQAQFLETALHSLVKQSYSNWELFIIDNHSTDNTMQIISNFIDSRISVLSISNKGSIAASRNFALKYVKGDWIAFLDSDDWWEFNKLEICSKFFDSQTDFIYHNMKVITDTPSHYSKNLIKSRQVNSPILKDLLLKGNTIATSSVVVRATIFKNIGGMNESQVMIGTEDFNAWLKISKVTENFRHLPEYLGFYRIHDQNTSMRKAFQLPRAAISEFLGELSPTENKLMLSQFSYTLGRLHFLEGDLLKSRRYLKLVLRSKFRQNSLKAFWMLTQISTRLYTLKVRELLKKWDSSRN